MPRFGQIRTSYPKAPAPFQHITLIGSVIMAVATGIMVYSNGGPERASQSVQPPAAQYYPVNRATPDLRGRTELEPLEIAPAKPVPVKPAVKLQANSGAAMLADLKRIAWRHHSGRPTPSVGTISMEAAGQPRTSRRPMTD